jgi:hypothetical protein
MTSDEDRDERIRSEVIVDAYTADQQALSWCYYLERTLQFPLRARCIEEQTASPLREGEEVRIIGMVAEMASTSEQYVLVEWMDRELGVSLSQLDVLDADDETREALDDWQYWV